MPAYDDAALDYLGEGWLPIPVRGKSIPVGKTTGYDGTVTVEKVAGWLNDDLNQRALDGRGVGVDSIGIRHHLTLAIDVDHGYGDKNGVQQLAEWATKLGLPPLPATWSSTARGDDSPSRQYLYRIAEDVTFKTKPCKSVELCTWHHRFTVCAPTIHPGTHTPYAWYLPGTDGVPPAWGARSDRIPAVDELAELPAEWFAALRGGVANADKSAVVVDLPELFATFTAGEPDGLVRHLITKWSDDGQHVGHDEFKNALINALMVGREGHPGVPELYAVLVDRYTRYLNVSRPDVAAHEVRSLVDACATIAQQKPVTRAADVLPPVGMGVDPLDYPALATDEELDTWLDTYTRFDNPTRLGRRIHWMKTDPACRLTWHARHLVAETFTGNYPADRAVRALAGAYRHHGGQDHNGPKALLSMALGAILNAKVCA
jgi:hypothetical protein